MEIINGLLFYITAFLMTVFSVMTLISRRIMHSVLYALIVFILFGLLYFSLNAPFNGVVQISIYGSALSIIFVIAIMLTNYNTENKEKYIFKPSHLLALTGILLISLSFVFFLKETVTIDWNIAGYLNSDYKLTDFSNLKQFSSEMLVKNIYPFELMGIYLLTALTGISLLLSFKGGK